MSMVRANLIQDSLFGVWHTTVPMRAYLYGQMDFPMAVFGSLVYILLSGMVGFAWGVFYKKTNSIWTSWSAHTLNNTTLNFVHITAAAGMPSTMPLRVTVIALVMVGLLPFVQEMDHALGNARSCPLDLRAEGDLLRNLMIDFPPSFRYNASERIVIESGCFLLRMN